MVLKAYMKYPIGSSSSKCQPKISLVQGQISPRSKKKVKAETTILFSINQIISSRSLCASASVNANASCVCGPSTLSRPHIRGNMGSGVGPAAPRILLVTLMQMS